MKKFLLTTTALTMVVAAFLPTSFANSNAGGTLWIATDTKGTAASATTDTTGYAIGETTITLAIAGTGTILTGDMITFAGDSREYRVITGDTDVSDAGSITIAEPGLQTAIAASAVAITIAGNVNPSEQASDLTLAQYAALTWTQVNAMGNHGEIGSSTNILTYDTWDTVVIQKAEGMTDAGSPDIEVARLPADYGQMALRIGAAVRNRNYAFKIIRDDASATGTPSLIYNRGLITGPKLPLGRNEDFDLEIFTLGLQQLPERVDAT